jgi:hypothetical protein
MATTTNYGWTTPDDTALVKDGAAAIRTLGSSVDTTTKALNPSTTLGDIEYRSATANTNTRLGIGTTGQVLTVAGGVPSWATPAGGGGKVLQVVQTTSTSSTSNSTSTYADATGLSVTITPSASTSRIMIQVVHQIYINNVSSDNSLQLRILRGATNIHQYGTELGLVGTAVKKQLQASAIYVDSPATTSATTYKVVFANYINGSQVAINDPASTMVMIATEIGA